MDELRVIKFSTMVSIVGSYVGTHGLDITDEEYDKMKKIVDKLVEMYDNETV